MEMMPKDIKREFLRRPREEIMEKLEITINEMLADDGPVPFQYLTEDDEWSNDGKFKGPGGEHIKNFGQEVCPSELLRDLYEKARGTQEHMAGCRCEKTLGVSVSNHPSWKRPVHGKDEALHHAQGEAGEIGVQ